MKKIITFFVLFFINQTNIYAQSDNEKFIVVTIENKSDEGLHKRETNYWLISLKNYVNSNEQSFYPLYTSGFSVNDYNECSKNNNLIFFNTSEKEDFNFEGELKNSQKELLHVIENKRIKVQEVRKKWITGKKTSVTVFLTPVTGKFCYCEFSGIRDMDYKEKISLPISDFEYDSKSENSELFKAIRKFDFSNLPSINLEKME